ncbi:hypothetical protein K435DRAFT_961510 [Dendrothele bispora CBS 962.96]|uniref:REJ domain-containing protein n=1 Tax=Dendrothele bispora (strain CBS 962.96) TaxID=1314807 RepID=A0A4V4HI38_DENBC|nr:hypothetical protein K435DRAFT_961510 [Dendrothele bispora CBS 962.96]
MFVPTFPTSTLELYIRQDPTGQSTSTRSTSSSSTSQSPSSTSISTSSASASSGSSSGTSSSSSSSQSSALTSSTASSTISSSASLTSSSSASASPTELPSSGSNKTGKLVGGIIGGVFGGLIVLSLLSILITAWRRRRHSARKRPRGSAFFDTKKPKNENGTGEQESLNYFLSPSPTPNAVYGNNTTDSTTSVPLLPLPDELRGTEHGDTLNSGQTLAPTYTAERSPYPMEEGFRDRPGRASESSFRSLPMPSPYSEHGHGDSQDDGNQNLGVNELGMPAPSFSATHSSDFRRLSSVNSDFSLAALTAASSLSPNLNPQALPAADLETTPTFEPLPAAAFTEFEMPTFDGVAPSKPVTSTDGLHRAASGSARVTDNPDTTQKP